MAHIDFTHIGQNIFVQRYTKKLARRKIIHCFNKFYNSVMDDSFEKRHDKRENN